MKKLLAGFLFIFCSIALAQPEPVPLRVTRYLGVTSTTVIDNRNSATRQNDMHTICSTGTATWSVQLQYSNTASTGPWSNFTNVASTVSDTTPTCVGLAYGNHSWIRLLVTGTATTTYSAVKQFYIPTEFLTTGAGIANLNGLTASSQTFATGTSGTDFAIASSTSTHTFNLPTASASNRGALSSADWSTFNAKQSALVNSSGLAGALSDETGSGVAVFGTAPTIDLPKFSTYTIGGTLPAAGVPNRFALVTNGLTSSDCTSGGGSAWVWCADNGTIWVHPGGAGAGSGITSLNGLIGLTQTFALGTTGTDASISSAGTTHTFNFPTASASNRGLLSAANWSTFNAKESALTFTAPIGRAVDTISLSLGTANQFLGMNAGATAWENKTLAAGSSGTDFAIAHTAGTVTFNLPTASGSARGLLSSSDHTLFSLKQSALTNSAGLRAALSDETGTGAAVFATGPTLELPLINAYTIGGTLPAAGTTKRAALVTNGASAVDCTVGGGTTYVWCIDNGTAWINPAGNVWTGGSYADPTWITSLAWSKITSPPAVFVGTNGVVGIGGASASFPGLKNSTTILQARLADDSALAKIQAAPATVFTDAVTLNSSNQVDYTLIPIASQAEAEAGSIATKFMTPQRTAQAIAVLAVTSVTAGAGAVVTGTPAARVVGADFATIPTKSTTAGTPTMAGQLKGSIGVDTAASPKRLYFSGADDGTDTTEKIRLAAYSELVGLPVSVANGGTGLASGTSGGVLAYTAAGTLASSGALTANLPVIGGGAGVAPSVGTRSGNTTAYVTTTGAQTLGDCVKIDANGNHIANGSACGGGSGTGEYSGAIDFGAIPDMSCLESTFAATGATTAMIVELSLPAAWETGLLANGWVSAADTAKVRACNFSGTPVNPVSATFKVKTINGYLSGSGTINFGAIPDMSCLASTVTVTGAAAGDHVTAGWPTAIETGLVGSMFVSATDTVAVRLCNQSGASVDPASATFKAAVIK